MTRLTSNALQLNGGPGSGNWGHSGRPGQVGGSGKTRGSSKENKKLDSLLKSVALTAAQIKGEDRKYGSIEELIMKKGSNFTPKELPEKIQKGEFKQCYSNAALLSASNPEQYIYCEGYALPDIGLDMPIAHAWCVDKNGNVIDNTWDKPGRAYKGIALKQEYLLEQLIKNGTYGVLSGSMNPNELLKNGIPENAIEKV